MLFVVVVVVLHTEPWLCLETGVGFFCGPVGRPLLCEGEMVSWIHKVCVVKSPGATPSPMPPLQPLLQRTWLFLTCSL